MQCLRGVVGGEGEGGGEGDLHEDHLGVVAQVELLVDNARAHAVDEADDHAASEDGQEERDRARHTLRVDLLGVGVGYRDRGEEEG